MKLSNRLYNISLNLHTISGVILCVVLMVIFYCGAFSLFKKEISDWEFRIDNAQTEIPTGSSLLDTAYQFLTEKPAYYGREVLIFQFEEKSNFKLFIESDSLNKRAFFSYTDQIKPINRTVFLEESLNNLLYHLHYLHPIPMVGIYIAGFISLFFVFSVFSGVLIRLKKIISDFFLLRKKKKRLTFLRDSHIVLGVITLPFQLMFAVTGGVFCLLFILIIPQVLIQFKGDTSELEKYFEDVPPTVEIAHKPYIHKGVASFVDEFELKNQVTLSYLRIYHFGDENMQLLLVGNNEKIDSEVKTLYQASTGEVVAHFANENAALFEHINHWTIDLHYANFGGIMIKIIFFILALVSCIVFYSGGLLWIETRNKKIKRINFYFEGTIWGLIIAVIISFLMRYFFNLIGPIFYSVWLVWALLAFAFSRKMYIKWSKIVATSLTLIFVAVYLVTENINSMHKLIIPLLCVIAIATFLLYQQKPIVCESKKRSNS